MGCLPCRSGMVRPLQARRRHADMSPACSCRHGCEENRHTCRHTHNHTHTHAAHSLTGCRHTKTVLSKGAFCWYLVVCVCVDYMAIIRWMDVANSLSRLVAEHCVGRLDVCLSACQSVTLLNGQRTSSVTIENVCLSALRSIRSVTHSVRGIKTLSQLLLPPWLTEKPIRSHPFISQESVCLSVCVLSLHTTKRVNEWPAGRPAVSIYIYTNKHSHTQRSAAQRSYLPKLRPPQPTPPGHISEIGE